MAEAQPWVNPFKAWVDSTIANPGDTVNNLISRIPSSDYMRGIGEHWSQSNAEAAKADPSAMAGLARAINPVTGLGSAIGNVYDAAEQGSVPGMLLGGTSAMPVMGKLGAMKAAGAIPFLGAGNRLIHQVPLFDRLAKDQVSNLIMGEVADGYNQQPIDDRVIQNLALFNSNPTQQPAIQLFPTYDSRPVSSAKSK